MALDALVTNLANMLRRLHGEDIKLTVTLDGGSLFTMADKDSSGSLSPREFAQCVRAYGVKEATAAAAFWLIDRDKSGRISREEFQTFMRDVFQSRALNDAAALVFGPGSRQ